ncbi:hypothetical protein BHE74_00031946, partial [Ensete ventricosum]
FRGITGSLGTDSLDLSVLLLGGPEDYPRACSAQGHFRSSKVGCASGTPRISVTKHVTNWAKGSLFPWLKQKREAVIGLGRALCRKFSSNSFASWSNEEIDDGFKQLYHIRTNPLSVSKSIGILVHQRCHRGSFELGKPQHVRQGQSRRHRTRVREA